MTCFQEDISIYHAPITLLSHEIGPCYSVKGPCIVFVQDQPGQEISRRAKGEKVCSMYLSPLLSCEASSLL